MNRDKGEDVGAERGCYIFAIRAGGGITPWYVGKTEKTFKDEIFTPDKKNKYSKGFDKVKKGTPVIFFLIRQLVQGAPFSKDEVQWIEKYLIHRALQKNPGLLNQDNTKYYTRVKIPGIHNARARSSSAKKLAEMLKVREPSGFTSAKGKFHKANKKKKD